MRLLKVNPYFKILVKLLILLIIILIIIAVLFFAKVTNFSLGDLNKDEPIQNTKKSTKELSDEEIKKINDSLEQRENRIKSLKEVGKNLGG
jgi:peptidoglycan hydrolase CwlO-like protein